MSHALPKTAWPDRFGRAAAVLSFHARPFVNSAGKLCRSLAMIGGGGLIIGFHVHWLRLPDAVLIRDYLVAPTVTETRDGLLLMVGYGALVMLLGVSYFREWKKSVRA